MDMKQTRIAWGREIARLRCNPQRRSSGPADPGGHITQSQLARLVGSSQPAVSEWERGTAAPSEELRSTIAHVLGTHPNLLFAYPVTVGAP